MFDFAPVESGVGIKRKRATQIEKTLRSHISDQGKCNTGDISKRHRLGLPMRKFRVRADVINPTEFCCPDGIADRSISRVRMTPRDLDAVQVVQAITGTCDRADGLLGVIFAVTNPGQPTPSRLHKHTTDRL